MTRVALFGVIFGLSVVILAVLSAWYVGSYQGGSASMAGMMSQMGGSRAVAGMTTSMPTFVWLSFAVLILVALTGAGGAAYYLTVPNIKTGVSLGERAHAPDRLAERSPEDLGVLMRTSKPDERKVLEVLMAHDSKYLQKFIVKESGLSRLKTHRIVSRLVERGVVVATKSGNTNEIALASWLTPQVSSPS